MITYATWVLEITWTTTLFFLGAFLCVLGFLSAIVVSTLDKVGIKQLGLDGAIQEESRKVVRILSRHIFLILACLVFLDWCTDVSEM